MADVMTVHLMRANTSESLGMIFVTPRTTGESIKLMVQTRLQALVPTLRCVYSGKRIDDSDTATTLGLEDNTTIMVIDPAAEAEGLAMSAPAGGRRRSKSHRRRHSRRVQ